jgi:hypothetical protein
MTRGVQTKRLEAEKLEAVTKMVEGWRSPGAHCQPTYAGTE